MLTTRHETTLDNPEMTYYKKAIEVDLIVLSVGAPLAFIFFRKSLKRVASRI
jgi:hypothetical protein